VSGLDRTAWSSSPLTGSTSAVARRCAVNAETIASTL
jgi:hypothetical protein